MEIKQLFDSNKDIYRTIEKVITYSASQEQRLKAEISEYVVTESIEEQFEKLLGKMQEQSVPPNVITFAARRTSIQGFCWLCSLPTPTSH